VSRRFVALAVLAVAACGDGDDQVAPAIDEIAPAIAAIEAELGGPQQYFEINATPQVVNLFVATEGATQVVPYVYVGGELAAAADTAGAEGSTFGADALTFDPATVLDAVEAELPDVDVVLYSVAGGPGGAVQYTASVQSGDGGSLDVVLGADGSIESVTPVG
jgi:hypothetical protein